MERLREGKHILSVQDIMSLWDCSWNDLIYCIIHRGLTPSFYLKRVMCECYCLNNEGGWVRKYPTSHPDGNPIIGGIIHRTGDFSLKLDMAESVPESCTLESLRESLSTNGRFNLCGVALVPIDDDYCDAVIPEFDYEISPDDFQFSLVEVQRFEAEHLAPAVTPATVPTVQVGSDTATELETETDAQLCERLKIEGRSDEYIAHELERAFPSIFDTRIGRLLPANPGANITNDAHKKRGKRLRTKALP